MSGIHGPDRLDCSASFPDGKGADRPAKRSLDSISRLSVDFAPTLPLQLEQNILGAFPQAELAERGEVFAALGEGLWTAKNAVIRRVGRVSTTTLSTVSIVDGFLKRGLSRLSKLLKGFRRRSLTHFETRRLRF